MPLRLCLVWKNYKDRNSTKMGDCFDHSFFQKLTLLQMLELD